MKVTQDFTRAGCTQERMREGSERTVNLAMPKVAGKKQQMNERQVSWKW